MKCITRWCMYITKCFDRYPLSPCLRDSEVYTIVHRGLFVMLWRGSHANLSRRQWGLPRNERILVTNHHPRQIFTRPNGLHAMRFTCALIVLCEFCVTREYIILQLREITPLCDFACTFNATIIFVYTFLCAGESARSVYYAKYSILFYGKICTFPGIPHLCCNK